MGFSLEVAPMGVPETSARDKKYDASLELRQPSMDARGNAGRYLDIHNSWIDNKECI
jgi:hypothetical protein